MSASGKKIRRPQDQRPEPPLHDPASSDAIGPPREEYRARRADERCRHDQQQCHRQRQTKAPCRVAHEVHQQDVAKPADAHIAAGGEENRAGVSAKDIDDRQTASRAGSQHVGEHRTLGDAQPNEHADGDEEDAGDERQPPSPRTELLGRQRRGHADEDQVRQHDAGRQAHGHDAAEQAATALRRVLHGHQHGAAPFAAEGKALNEAARGQQRRRPGADLRVGGEQSDAERRRGPSASATTRA